MRTKLYKFILGVFISTCVIGFTGCGDEIIEEHYYESGARMERYEFPVKKNMWTWNPETRKYEIFFNDFKELDADIYRLGAINVTVFVDPKTNNEIQYSVPHPYVFGIRQPDGSLYTYTQYITYDAIPGSIGFFLQSSDLGQDEFDLIDCTFKVSLFYNVEDFN